MQQTNTLNIIYVDDSKIARIHFGKVVARTLDINNQVNIFHNAIEALEYCQNNKVHIAFLDIEMPDNNGLWLASQLIQLNISFAFVTAYNHFAKEAFELKALNYLIKPINASGIKNTIQRFQQSTFISHQISSNDLIARENTNYPKRILLNNAHKTLVIDLSQVMYFLASGSYTHIFDSHGKKTTSTKPLRYYWETLGNHPDFIKLHRSNIVNKFFVKAVLREKAKISILMQNDERLEVSPTLRESIYSSLI